MRIKVKLIILFVFVFIFMEGVSWWAYKSFSSRGTNESSKTSEEEQIPMPLPNPISQPEEKPDSSQISDSQNSTAPETSPADLPPTAMDSAGSEGGFPPPQTVVVNGVTERTIHMGVRQWVWEPATITAKQGELVRLVIHNADVKHAIVIPDLDVRQDIPPDGAVVEFKATKKGTFEFLCATYCGVGHAEMEGKIIIG